MGDKVHLTKDNFMFRSDKNEYKDLDQTLIFPASCC